MHQLFSKIKLVFDPLGNYIDSRWGGKSWEVIAKGDFLEIGVNFNNEEIPIEKNWNSCDRIRAIDSYSVGSHYILPEITLSWYRWKMA